MVSIRHIITIRSFEYVLTLVRLMSHPHLHHCSKIHRGGVLESVTKTQIINMHAIPSYIIALDIFRSVISSTHIQ